MSYSKHSSYIKIQGDLSKMYDRWRAEIIKSIAHVEAVIDFSEDAEISDDVAKAVLPVINNLVESMTRHLNDARKGERLRDGAHMIIIGPPNAGKSSLLNLLAQRQAAIVSPIPGTTRDIVEVVINLGGYPLLIGDTAGIRMSTDTIEQEGIQRATERYPLMNLSVNI
jgi:tRNA modification GTPase